MAKKKFYAVAIGRTPGIYESWPECEQQTKGFRGGRFKSFPTRALAQGFIDSVTGNTSVSQAAPRRDINPREESEPPSTRPAKRQRTESQDSPNTRVTTTINAYFDGGSRGNPGLAGAGANIAIATMNDDGSVNHTQTIQVRKYIGTNETNNIAEYHGLLCGLTEANKAVVKLNGGTSNVRVQIKGDSDLIIQQMNGVYQCKSQKLLPLYKEAIRLTTGMRDLNFVEISFEHVYREGNAVADALANEAMDTRRTWTTVEEDSISNDDSSPPDVPQGNTTDRSTARHQENRPDGLRYV